MEYFPQDTLMISVLAKPNDTFAGYDLLQAIATAGLQFGEKNLFHFYRSIENKNEIIFSLATATKSGEFDLNNMGDVSCKGLILFFNFKTAHDPKESLDCMLNTAQQLADVLDGDLYSNPQNRWNNDTEIKYYEKIAQVIT
jgi:cell division protein ZipA